MVPTWPSQHIRWMLYLLMVQAGEILYLERIRLVLWDSKSNSHGGHVGVPNKRSYIKFFCQGTPIWRLWRRQVNTLFCQYVSQRLNVAKVLSSRQMSLINVFIFWNKMLCFQSNAEKFSVVRLEKLVIDILLVSQREIVFPSATFVTSSNKSFKQFPFKLLQCSRRRKL